MFLHLMKQVTMRQASLGVKPNTSAALIARMLDAGNPGAAKIRRKLDSFSVDLPDCQAVELLAGDTPAGSGVKLTSERELICLICAPGESMAVDGADPPTDLVGYISRATPGYLSENDLPDPLGDELQSFRI